MNKSITKLFLTSIFSTFLIGCGPNIEEIAAARLAEAKKLGFSSAAEMQEIQRNGWHTKKKFEEDRRQMENDALRAAQFLTEKRDSLAKQEEEKERKLAHSLGYDSVDAMRKHKEKEKEKEKDCETYRYVQRECATAGNISKCIDIKLPGGSSLSYSCRNIFSPN